MLYVLEQKRVSPKIIYRAVKKSLDLFLPQVDSDNLIEAGHGHQIGHQFANNASSLPHFACHRQQWKRAQKKKENWDELDSGKWQSPNENYSTYAFLDVLDEKGRGSEVVNSAVEKSEAFLGMEVDCYDVIITSLDHELGQKF